MSDVVPSSSVVFLGEPPNKFSVDVKWFPNGLELKQGEESLISIEGMINGFDASSVEFITLDNHRLKMTPVGCVAVADSGSFKAAALICAPDNEGELDLAHMKMVLELVGSDGSVVHTVSTTIKVAVSAAEECKLTAEQKQKLHELARLSELREKDFDRRFAVKMDQMDRAVAIVTGDLDAIGSNAQKIVETMETLRQLIRVQAGYELQDDGSREEDEPPEEQVATDAFSLATPLPAVAIPSFPRLALADTVCCSIVFEDPTSAKLTRGDSKSVTVVGHIMGVHKGTVLIQSSNNRFYDDIHRVVDLDVYGDFVLIASLKTPDTPGTYLAETNLKISICPDGCDTFMEIQDLRVSVALQMHVNRVRELKRLTEESKNTCIELKRSHERNSVNITNSLQMLEDMLRHLVECVGRLKNRVARMDYDEEDICSDGVTLDKEAE